MERAPRCTSETGSCVLLVLVAPRSLRHESELPRLGARLYGIVSLCSQDDLLNFLVDVMVFHQVVLAHIFSIIAGLRLMMD